MNSTVEFKKSIMQNGYYTYEFWNSETFQPHKLLINLADKINLKRSNKYVAFIKY